MAYNREVAENDKLITAVGRAYRAGQISAQDICKKYEIGRSTLYRWAARWRWKRDLATDVRVIAKRKAMVSQEKRAKVQAAGESVEDIPDDEIVEDFSDLGAIILVNHRGLIGKLREKVDSMFLELERHRRYVRWTLRSMIGTESVKVGFGKNSRMVPGSVVKAEFMGEMMLKQSSMLRDLAQTAARLVPLERQAFSLDNRDDRQTYEQALKELYESEPEPTAPVGHVTH